MGKMKRALVASVSSKMGRGSRREERSRGVGGLVSKGRKKQFKDDITKDEVTARVGK